MEIKMVFFSIMTYCISQVKLLLEQEKMKSRTWFCPSGIDWIVVVC